MTHCMTKVEKLNLQEEIRDLTTHDILQREDAVEIYRITMKACSRVLSVIDDPRPIQKPLKEAVENMHINIDIDGLGIRISDNEFVDGVLYSIANPSPMDICNCIQDYFYNYEGDR